MKINNKDFILIGCLSEKLGISTRTIRWYEEIGLVELPKRTGRTRYYEMSDVDRFKFVLKVKELGLSLEEMKELASLYDLENKLPDKIMPRLVELLESHSQKIREKIAALKSLEKDITAFRQIVGQCCSS